MQRSLALLAGVLVSTPVVFVQQAFAQNEAREVEEVITTGTRAQERSSSESPAPIDVITGEDFTNQAETDLANLVRNVVPSFNVNTQPISDAATIVRPANLRGLAPDHTLVLVNGKRRHRAAVISWLGNGVADGSQGPDLATIPSIALKQVEVLRDGASSQYGSDAIAGVMNFILKDSNDGASIEAKFGQYSEGDGDLYSIAGNIGLPFSDDGFANLSFEYSESDPTDRSVQRTDAANLIAAGNTAVANPAQIWGSPLVKDDIKLFGNVGLDLGNETEFYAHANLSSKFVDGGFYFRNPNTRGGVFSGDGGATLLVGDLLDAEDGVLDGTAGCPTITITNDVPDQAALNQVINDPNCFTFQEIFPGGFTPRFGGDVSDAQIVAGVRGEMKNGLRWDVSASGARNEVDFFIRNTVNASLGPNTPTFFNPGDYTQYEQAVNADFGFSPTPETNLAFGAEFRNEEFQITTGDEASFEIGPLAEQGFSAASNGFPGFSNIAGGKNSRENVALYVDGEWEATDELLLGAAV
ncbi:MAG: TonB-dependent receptor plug domain-containing protein, partial [Gammaproteobacteria bacterium]|nr:TonB-dependent receptor plug domain-containing protein [Gammaproteobacteria bacterium]